MPESAPKRELSYSGIYEIDGGIADADIGISEIDKDIADADIGISEIDEGTSISVDISILVDNIDKEVSVAANTVSNSYFRVACRAARGIDS